MSAPPATPQVAVRASIGASGYAVDTVFPDRIVRADEPEALGGAGTGPDPFQLLYAALVSCVLITVRMYASRKDWPLQRAELEVHPVRRPGAPLESARLLLTLKGPLSEEQRRRLLEIAGRCPVHRSFENGVHIETALAD